LSCARAFGDLTACFAFRGDRRGEAAKLRAWGEDVALLGVRPVRRRVVPIGCKRFFEDFVGRRYDGRRLVRCSG